MKKQRKHKFQVGDTVVAEGKVATVQECLWSMSGTPVYVTSAAEWVLYEKDVRKAEPGIVEILEVVTDPDFAKKIVERKLSLDGTLALLKHAVEWRIQARAAGQIR